MGTCFDKRGIPIHVGDLLKSFHFKSYRRRINYLYHVVFPLEDGSMVAIPLAQALGGRAQGGDVRFGPGDVWLEGVEIVAATVPDGNVGGFEFRKRAKRKGGA